MSVIGNEIVKLRALDIVEYMCGVEKEQCRLCLGCGRPSLLRQMSGMSIYVKDFVLGHVDIK